MVDRITGIGFDGFAGALSLVAAAWVVVYLCLVLGEDLTGAGAYRQRFMCRVQREKRGFGSADIYLGKV